MESLSSFRRDPLYDASAGGSAVDFSGTVSTGRISGRVVFHLS